MSSFLPVILGKLIPDWADLHSLSLNSHTIFKHSDVLLTDLTFSIPETYLVIYYTRACRTLLHIPTVSRYLVVLLTASCWKEMILGSLPSTLPLLLYKRSQSTETDNAMLSDYLFTGKYWETSQMLKLEEVCRNLNEFLLNVAKQHSHLPINCAIRQQDTIRYHLYSCLWYSAPAPVWLQCLCCPDGAEHYLCHLCRCWRSCCSRCFGTDTGFCSLAGLVRSESSPLPGLVWSSAETERDYINVKLLGYFSAILQDALQLLHLCAAGQAAQKPGVTSLESGSVLEHGCQHWAHHLL